MTDEKIVRGLKRKNTDALAELMEQYGRYVAGIIGQLLQGYGTAQDVEELMADVFLAVWNASDRLDLTTYSSLKGYLGTVARNKAKDFLRKKNLATLALDDDILVFSDSVEKEFLQKEQQTIVKKALDRLSAEDNAFIFGLSAQEVINFENNGGYDPHYYFNTDQDIRRVLMSLINGTYQHTELFRDLYDSLLTDKFGKADRYFILADFKSYAAAQQRVEEAYRDEKRWARMAMLNVAKSGKFTSDRTIQQYVDEIWKLDRVKVEPTESNF